MIPISTILVAYIGALFIGKKLNILNENTNEKYIIISNFKKYGAYICCSKKTYIFGIIYLIIYEILNLKGFEFNFVYFRIYNLFPCCGSYYFGYFCRNLLKK